MSTPFRASLRKLWRAAALTAAAITVLALPGAASAGQAQNANAHQWWRLPGSAWNIDQKVVVANSSNAMYYALTVWTQNGTTAYMGLQQGGDGRRMARFSFWNSTAALPGPGASCRPFDGEGVGRTCEVPINWGTSRWYTYRMWRLTSDVNGDVWGAWIIDDAGRETHIGNIRAPRGAGEITQADSFNEYWGSAYACNSIPYSAVWYLAPSINNGRGRATFGTNSVGNCSGGLVTPTIYGTSKLELGHFR